jgi:hypothetical protein
MTQAQDFQAEVELRREYPKWKYHRNKAGVVVKNPQEEAALGPGWADAPGAFNEEAAIVTSERSDPLLWVDDWQVPGLVAQQREKIKAQLLIAAAVFSRGSPENHARHVAPMKTAFNGIAEVLFDAGILTAKLLENEIRELVWDSAIAGGWWRPASDERTDGFPERVGHYWVWADHVKDCAARLFGAETFEWRSRLLETPARTQSHRAALPSHKTPAQLLTGYKVAKKIRTHELVAESLGLERSVYFDLKASRRVSEETYIKAALGLGCSPDDLKP